MKVQRAPGETKFVGRPPDKAIKQIRDQRVVYAKKLQEIDRINKLDAFIDEWLASNGNATQAAMKVFKCKSRAVAASVGSEYLKKAKSLVRLYMEEKGYTYGKMIQTATNKMERSKSPEWWDRLMKLAGYEDFMTKKEPAVSVNILNAQKDILKGYVQEVDVVDGEDTEG